jgi:Uma2 family endonuclease
MLARAFPQITRSDYEALPDGPPYFQLIEGELIMSPSPNLNHQRVVGRIFSALLTFTETRKVGEVFIAPLDVHLTDVNIYQTDILFISNKRKRELISPQAIEGAPDLVIEVLSVRTSKYDRGAKKKIYAQSGVKELWLIDIDSRSIEQWKFEDKAERCATLSAPKDHLSSSLLPGFKLSLKEIFARI